MYGDLGFGYLGPPVGFYFLPSLRLRDACANFFPKLRSDGSINALFVIIAGSAGITQSLLSYAPNLNIAWV
jgi:hypothetical protein